MSQDPLPLDDTTPKARRHGPALAAVERSLSAWRAAGHMVGPAFAAAARVLRDSAAAVDAAHASMSPARCPRCLTVVPDAYTGSPGALAYANNIHAQLLAQAMPATTTAADDPYGDTTDDAALSELVAAALAGEGPAAPGDPAGLNGH